MSSVVPANSPEDPVQHQQDFNHSRRQGSVGVDRRTWIKIEVMEEGQQNPDWDKDEHDFDCDYRWNFENKNLHDCQPACEVTPPPAPSPLINDEITTKSGYRILANVQI